MNKKVLIVGGIAGGASTAARLRRLNESYEIIMFERGEYISFANCGLPYYIGGTIRDREDLLVQTVEKMSNRFNIDIRNFSEVKTIDRDNKRITVENLKSGEFYEESYDYLVLSPGAAPIKPSFPGADEAHNIFTLRNIPDTDAIKSYIDKNRPEKAVVIGGGYIGIEMAENLYKKGIKVTLVEMLDQLMSPVDFEMASIVHDYVKEKGIKLVLKDGVKAFKEKGRRVKLYSGNELESDMTIISIGVKPENGLAKNAGLEIGQYGGILVDEYLRTSDPYIYAVGDAIQVADNISGKSVLIPLAGPANRQGRTVADNISGEQTKYTDTLATSIVKIFNMTVAVTGMNEKTLRKLNMNYRAVHIHPGSHAGYYPGATPISLKMLFNPDTWGILGAQAVGYKGADKRIDVIATAIKGDLSVFDLQGLDLCYAPPFSSAKDPVNMAGYVAGNIIKGKLNTVQWYEIDEIVQNGGFLIDVRRPEELKQGFVDGSVNIPIDQLRQRISEIPYRDCIYVICQFGVRGYFAVRFLMQNGYNVKNVDGGYYTYSYALGTNSDENGEVYYVKDTGEAQPVPAIK